MSLVLSRRKFETIVIFTGADEQISITVGERVSDQVKLVIDAPDSVDIWREELLEPE